MKNLLQQQNVPLPVFTDCELSPAQANQGQQLSGIKKELGSTYLITVLSLQINTALQLLPSQPTTPDAVAGVSKIIISEFWALKLEEILLAFKRGIAGRYGKIYGGLSLNVFIEWINGYITEQASDHSELVAEREKENHNKKFEGTQNDAEVFAKFTTNEKFKHQPPEQRTGKPISIKEMLEENEQKNIETIEAIKFAVEKGILTQEQIDKKISPTK